MAAENTPEGIEAEIKNKLRPVVHDFTKPAGPDFRPQIDARNQNQNQQAFLKVEQSETAEVLQMESFVDAAMNARVTAVRGAYRPGPRDAYVRRRLIEWLLTITADNGAALDR